MNGQTQKRSRLLHVNLEIKKKKEKKEKEKEVTTPLSQRCYWTIPGPFRQASPIDDPARAVFNEISFDLLDYVKTTEMLSKL